MIERTLFSADHEAFRDSFRRFMEKEIAPHHEAWEEQGYVDRAVWNKAGENGFLCMTLPEAYGGSDADKLYSVAQMEELARGGFSGIGYGLHSEIVAPYILHYGTEAQKAKYLPLLASGEMVGAIAMSEPAAGSDLQGVKTTALKQADGSYLMNGSKTFITNGPYADTIVFICRLDEGNPESERKVLTFVLERGIRADLSLVKAWKADPAGNLIYRKTARNFNPMAATCGKVTVAEVEELVGLGELDPDRIDTPGIFVQRIVVTTSVKRIEQRTVSA